MWLRVLRPLKESLGVVVRNVDLRQPDEESNVSTTTLVYALEATIRVTRAKHGPRALCLRR
jgi:hypothetical protein